MKFLRLLLTLLLLILLLLSSSIFPAQVVRIQQYKTSGGGGGFSPTDIPGLKLWLKADSLSLSDGDPVGTWSDSSGNGNDGTQSTGSNKPTYKTAIQNGKPIIRFNSAFLNYLTFPDFLSAMTAGQVFIVVKANADNHANGLWDMGDPTNGNTGSWYPWDDGTIYEGWGTSSRKTTGNPTTALDAFVLYSVASASGNFTTYINGVQFYTTGTNTTSWPTAPILGRNSESTYFPGDIGEVIIYNSVLSTANRQSVETYLNGRWAIY